MTLVMTVVVVVVVEDEDEDPDKMEALRDATGRRNRLRCKF